MSKQFMAVIAAIIVIFAGIALFTGNSSDKTGSKSSSTKTLTQHIQGKGEAGVTLVEYADYQCPYCEAYYPTLKQVQQEYGDQIKFQFRNFPLQNAHPNAFAAARAAEAADQQGKFWEMHDLLYDSANWQAWTNSTNPNSFFNRYAQLVGINVDTFKADFASSKINDLVNADLNEGYRLDIQGTPTFFLNGKQVQIANSADSFKKVIDAEIAKQKKTSSNNSSTNPAGSTQPTGTESTVVDTPDVQN